MGKGPCGNLLQSIRAPHLVYDRNENMSSFPGCSQHSLQKNPLMSNIWPLRSLSMCVPFCLCPSALWVSGWAPWGIHQKTNKRKLTRAQSSRLATDARTKRKWTARQDHANILEDQARNTWDPKTSEIRPKGFPSLPKSRSQDLQIVVEKESHISLSYFNPEPATIRNRVLARSQGCGAACVWKGSSLKSLVRTNPAGSCMWPIRLLGLLWNSSVQGKNLQQCPASTGRSIKVGPALK